MRCLVCHLLWQVEFIETLPIKKGIKQWRSLIWEHPRLLFVAPRKRRLISRLCTETPKIVKKEILNWSCCLDDWQFLFVWTKAINCSIKCWMSLQEATPQDWCATSFHGCSVMSDRRKTCGAMAESALQLYMFCFTTSALFVDFLNQEDDKQQEVEDHNP